MLNFRKRIKRCISVLLAAAMIIGCSAGISAVSSRPGNETAATTPTVSTPAQSTAASAQSTTASSNTATTTTTATTTATAAASTPSDTEDPEETTDITEDPEETSETEEPALPVEIELSSEEYHLEVGQGVQLQAQLINAGEDQPEITFYSSNTESVRVDAYGYIMAVGAGSAWVYATSGDVSARAAVYVSEPPVVPEYIVLTEDSFELKINETAQINAKLYPEEAAAGYELSYSSGNTDVAQVDENGLVTAISEGEAYITVSGAGLYETVYVSVSSDIAYETARLDGYLYDNNGNPISGSRLLIDELTAVTDADGYFVFESVEERSVTIKLEDDENASCELTLTEDTTVYLLYNGKTLERLGSYDELAGQLKISKVSFVSSDIVLTVGEVYELSYQYEPKDATITEINYESSIF